MKKNKFMQLIENVNIWLSNIKNINFVIVLIITILIIFFSIGVLTLIFQKIGPKDILPPLIISLSALLASAVAIKNMSNNYIDKKLESHNKEKRTLTVIHNINFETINEIKTMKTYIENNDKVHKSILENLNKRLVNYYNFMNRDEVIILRDSESDKSAWKFFPQLHLLIGELDMYIKKDDNDVYIDVIKIKLKERINYIDVLINQYVTNINNLSKEIRNNHQEFKKIKGII